MTRFWQWLLALCQRRIGATNPNGSGVYDCSCCGCGDGCDEHCRKLQFFCRVHGWLPNPISIDQLFRAIEHGDAQHRQWLRDKLREFFHIS